jgi:hypothetical protein
MDEPACMVYVDAVMPVGTYAIGVKVTDYIQGNPTPMSIVPAKFIIQILANDACNTR